MEKHDARNLNDDALHERRKHVIRLFESGNSRAQIGQLTELSATAVAKIIRLYSEGGLPALKPRRRGRKIGEERRLTPDQEREIQQIVCGSSPSRMQLSCAVWDRAAIRQLILTRYQIDLAIRTVGHYLKRWNFVPKRVQRRESAIQDGFRVPNGRPVRTPAKRSYAPKGQVVSIEQHAVRAPVRTGPYQLTANEAGLKRTA
jgi:transposase